MANLPPVYPNDIPTLQELHPALPILADIDTNRQILADTLIDTADLKHATALADLLQEYQNIGHPHVTDEVVNTASLRAINIQAAHAAVKFTPLDLAARLEKMEDTLKEMSDNVKEMSDNVKEMSASSRNVRIILRNKERGTESGYIPLLKTVEGDGLELARNALPNIRDQLLPPDDAPLVGKSPPAFNPHVIRYQRMEIARLIIFYNDDFNIVPGDSLPKCVEKFIIFLTTLY